MLLFYGTGSVQGFATTLLLGVITSLITAIVVTRFLLTSFVRAVPAGTGRPGYDPRDMLKLYIYGYLNRCLLYTSRCV